MVTTLRGIPIRGDRPVITRTSLLVLLNTHPEEAGARMQAVHWPFPEQSGPALCGMPLLVGVTFAGYGAEHTVTCPDCLEWMRS